MILCIFASATQLAMDTPLLDPTSYTKKVLSTLDTCLICIFTVEALLKIFVYGLINNGPKSYLRASTLDFSILMLTYLCLTPLGQTLKVVKTFKISKALRLISRNEGLQVAVRALIFAIPNVFKISLIMGLFYLIFGVINISYFKGTQYYCYQALQELEETLLTKWDCLDAGGTWELYVYNWDNIQNAVVTLFVMATTAGWNVVTLQTLASNGVDMIPDPSKERDPVWIMYFTLFMLIGSIFFINLFVGVVQTTFRSEHARVGGDKLLTEKQKEWIELKLLVLRSAPSAKLKPPQNAFRRFAFKI